jgi:hypothetical protein
MALMVMVFMSDKVTIATSSLNHLTWQVCKVVYSLGGLPIIAMALWGCIQRVERLVRGYFWYGLMTVLLDMIFIFDNFVLSNPCDHLPHMLQGQGHAAACGAARGIDAMFVIVVTGIQAYLIFIIWSYCEDLYEGGGLEIGDLAKDLLGRPLTQQAIRKRLLKDDPATSIMGLRDKQQHPPGFCHTCLDYLCCCCGPGLGHQLGFQGGYNTMMDAPDGFGLAGRRGIFNGWYHEMAYPPPSHLMKTV